MEETKARAKPSSSKKGVRPPSGKRKPKPALEDEDGGDTFLTDINKLRSAKKSTHAPSEIDEEDEDELQDIVYDYE